MIVLVLGLLVLVLERELVLVLALALELEARLDFVQLPMDMHAVSWALNNFQRTDRDTT